MKKTYNTEPINKLWRIASPEEITESLDNILFSACIRYLDPYGGSPSEQNVIDVNNVRFLLEALRECSTNSK